MIMWKIIEADENYPRSIKRSGIENWRNFWKVAENFHKINTYIFFSSLLYFLIQLLENKKKKDYRGSRNLIKFEKKKNWKRVDLRKYGKNEEGQDIFHFIRKKKTLNQEKEKNYFPSLSPPSLLPCLLTWLSFKNQDGFFFLYLWLKKKKSQTETYWNRFISLSPSLLNNFNIISYKTSQRREKIWANSVWFVYGSEDLYHSEKF